MYIIQCVFLYRVTGKIRRPKAERLADPDRQILPVRIGVQRRGFAFAR